VALSKSPLDSPALGTGLEDLVKECGDKLRPQDPGRVIGRPTFGLTFSGGGFRATLAALGVVRYLADAGRLGDVRFVSSVSGGSIANGVVACQWGRLREAGFTSQSLDELVVDPIVRSIAGSSLKTELFKNIWRLVGPTTRTDLLARALDGRFFHGRTLESLDEGCRFIINAANLITGVRFTFERDVLGDYVVGLAPAAGTGMRVATAVAASAAVPGAFAPVVVRGIDFPCSERGEPQLVDGGAYDNTGLEALDGDRYGDVFLVVMDSGGVFATGRWGGLPFIRNLMRANSLLYRQTTGLRTRWMVDRFQAGRETAPDEPSGGDRQGVLMRLASSVRATGSVKLWRERFPEHRTWGGRDLAFVPTVFDQLDPQLCRLLVYRGWWLTGAMLALWYPGSVPQPGSAPPLE
jgi:NTE family protein